MPKPSFLLEYGPLLDYGPFDNPIFSGLFCPLLQDLLFLLCVFFSTKPQVAQEVMNAGKLSW